MSADASRTFLIGYMDAEDHQYLDGYLDWYINVLGIPPAHLIMGVRNDPENTNAPLLRCNDIFNRYRVPRWSELWMDADISEWRQNEQDTYIHDRDWVLHAKLNDHIEFRWTDGDVRLLQEWLEAYDFDCVKGQVVEHVSADGQGSSSGEIRVAMARGYWYVCNDGLLCPQFEESAWQFPSLLHIHRFMQCPHQATGHTVRKS